MARNIKTISQLAHQTAKELNRSPQKWIDCLQTAGRLYQYPFADQLLIYAQRPNATACAYMEQWNEKMHRWINAGSIGIAVIRSQNGERRLGYLFDIADTHPVKGAKHPWTWQLSPEYEAVVSQAFAEQYGTVALEDVTSQLMEYAARAAAEHCKEYLSDMQYRKTNSFLEELDDQSTEVTFHNLLTASVQYMVLSRCGLDPSGYLNEDDFRAITNFNTPRMFYHLGNAVSQTGKEVLQTISRTIRNAVRTAQMQQEALEKEEGSIDNAGNHIPNDGKLSDSRTRTAQVEQTGEIRADAGAVSEAGAQRDLYRASADGGTGRAPQGDRAESDQTDGTTHQPDGKQGGIERGAQSDRSDGVDSQDEQHPAKSRGDSENRRDAHDERRPQLHERRRFVRFFGQGRVVHLECPRMHGMCEAWGWVEQLELAGRLARGRACPREGIVVDEARAVDGGEHGGFQLVDADEPMAYQNREVHDLHDVAGGKSAGRPAGKRPAVHESAVGALAIGYRELLACQIQTGVQARDEFAAIGQVAGLVASDGKCRVMGKAEIHVAAGTRCGRAQKQGRQGRFLQSNRENRLRVLFENGFVGSISGGVHEFEIADRGNCHVRIRCREADERVCRVGGDVASQPHDSLGVAVEHVGLRRPFVHERHKKQFTHGVDVLS